MYQASKYAILKRVLNKILHRIYLTGFLNVSDFIKKTLNHIHAWQGSDYSSGSAYTKVLNLPRLQKVINKNDVS